MSESIRPPRSYYGSHSSSALSRPVRPMGLPPGEAPQQRAMPEYAPADRYYTERTIEPTPPAETPPPVSLDELPPAVAAEMANAANAEEAEFYAALAAEEARLATDADPDPDLEDDEDDDEA